MRRNLTVSIKKTSKKIVDEKSKEKIVTFTSTELQARKIKAMKIIKSDEKLMNTLKKLSKE